MDASNLAPSAEAIAVQHSNANTKFIFDMINPILGSKLISQTKGLEINACGKVG